MTKKLSKCDERMTAAAQYLIICFTALVASGLTLFSGFGLGTLLMPVFAIFFPLEIAIALTAIVHFLNNIFKLSLLRNHTDTNIVLKFGIPSVIFAFAGAFCLNRLSHLEPLTTFSINEKEFFIFPVKLAIAVLIFIFSLIELVPSLSKLEFDNKFISLGGALSGFLGGFSGNQGALRTAFLIKANLSKETFIATGVVIACMVDVSRLTVYARQIALGYENMNYYLLIAATLSAFAGSFIGRKLMKKITLKFVQRVVGVMLILFSIALGLGVI